MNITLSMARIFSKLHDKKKEILLLNVEKSFREYERLKKFMDEFMKSRNILKWQDLPQAMVEPYRMMSEMIELLPVKLNKLTA